MSTAVKVRNLLAEIPADDGARVQTMLSNIAVTETGDKIVITEDHFEEEQNPATHEVELDPIAEQTLSRFLNVPFKYIESLPGELKATNLNYWLNRAEDAQAVFYIKNNGLEEVYDPNRMVIPTRRVADIITSVFDGNDDVVQFHHDEKVFQIDITSERYQVSVDGNGLLDRPAQGSAADITNGGVRIFLPTDLKTKKPRISTYYERLICSNGMVRATTEDEVTLKGKTVDDVLEELEGQAEELLGNMDRSLAQYKATAEMMIPGNHIAFIRQVGREQGVSATTIEKALDYAAGFGDREWSLYDVINLYTSLGRGARFATANRLQALGGLMVTHAEHMIDRCGNCEQLLPTSHYADLSA